MSATLRREALRSKRMETFQKPGRIAIGLTVPAFAILLAVFGVPIIHLFLTSINAPAFSLANYQAFLDQQANVRVLFQTIEVSVVPRSSVS